MNFDIRILLFVFLTAIAIACVFAHVPIAQDIAYHNLADTRTIMGIQNFANVISNFPFLVVGFIGLHSLNRTKVPRARKVIYAALFIGIFLTGFGSAYYHYLPNNNNLVWDRIPMTIVFMSLLAATIAEHIHLKSGTLLFYPLLVIGISSVIWWHYTELNGAGDLRLYGLVQFYPMIFIPLILWLFPAPAYNRGLYQLIWVIIWYLVAKIFEHYDKQIYAVTYHFISGHSLKHLAAALATWYLVRMFRKNYTI